MLQGIFADRNSFYFLIRSLIPQQAAGNALALAAHAANESKNILTSEFFERSQHHGYAK
jgi:hypothetical protein